MSDDIKLPDGQIVGSWNGNSAKEFMVELKRVREALAAAGSGAKLNAREMPHRDQIPADLQSFNAYPLWGCDKEGNCLVGAAANRIEPIQKVRTFSLVDHH